MPKSTRTNRKYTPEFKIMVCEEYLSGKSGGYGTIGKIHEISFRRVHDWVKIYNQKGPESFWEESRGKHSTGKPKNSNYNQMTLEEKVQFLEMENAILKKAKALRLNKSGELKDM